MQDRSWSRWLNWSHCSWFEFSFDAHFWRRRVQYGIHSKIQTKLFAKWQKDVLNIAVSHKQLEYVTALKYNHFFQEVVLKQLVT